MDWDDKTKSDGPESWDLYSEKHALPEKYRDPPAYTAPAPGTNPGMPPVQGTSQGGYNYNRPDANYNSGQYSSQPVSHGHQQQTSHGHSQYGNMPPPSYNGQPMQHQYNNMPPPNSYNGQYNNMPPPNSYNGQPMQQQRPPVIVTQPQRRGHNRVAPANGPYRGRPNSYITMSICTAICCNPIFGLIAIIFSLLSYCAAEDDKMDSARRHGKIALGLCVAGIIVSILISIALVVYFVASGESSPVRITSLFG